MGNAPSSPQSPASQPTAHHRPSSSSVSAQPIAAAGAPGSSSHRGSSTFHSGITPPTSPPSPPAPSTPTLLPYAGHLSPQNPHCLSLPQAHDYSKSVVTRQILDGKLAPFYRGLEDYEEDWTEDDIIRELNEQREKDYEEGVANSFTERLREEREGSGGMGQVTKKIGINKGRETRREGEKEEREKREKRVYRNAIECPICFLNYPPNINTSRCCQQPLCTECFVQIKRSEATITHLESEPACCPFCVETDFGVIYERPTTPLSSLSDTALATSPGDSALASGFSSLGVGSDAELTVGPGMNPLQKETLRRKSVSSKAKEVVTIDEIRPDWEAKLNAVKAAAARKASRRIVMRQVGDRLVPIGYTSSRATGTADFSMSVGADSEGSSSIPGRRPRRRESNRERELEELMIMEAIRLSMVDHEEHQRKQAGELRNGSTTDSGPAPSTSSPGPPPGPSTSAALATTPAPSSPTQTTGPRSSAPTETTKDKQSGPSKLLSKFNNVRARANSAASGKALGSSFSANRARGNSASQSNLTVPPPLAPSTSTSSNSTSSSAAPSPIPSTQSPIDSTHAAGPPVPPKSGLNPTSPAPAAVSPVTTLASPSAAPGGHQSGDLMDEDSGSAPLSGASTPGGLPRLSVDMPALTPDTTGPGQAKAVSASGSSAAGLQDALGSAMGSTSSSSGSRPKQQMQRAHSNISEITEPETESGGVGYAQLDSDGE
ncbi:zf-C3HC4 type zinc finger protein [Cryptococcus wingfieldii CBS 7118]|uniref:Zf-C3HC4 type zinc finger protein n=1 Tax=Cryptococcus wingfieldii CBS 7118 TaxID=1295528 RepID=A0A1E3JR81_9TREE|nr:zf-C3HC4 type zinc finger protein [Cryptococcus wingfieldii CBS 7118]ODO03370.1 zf-C3HC4 type zinc finger protein [Cryptococcus wingfieldii CBS 7118]